MDSSNRDKSFLVQMTVGFLVESEEAAMSFIENHTQARTIFIESDIGEPTEINTEYIEIDELVDCSEENQ